MSQDLDIQERDAGSGRCELTHSTRKVLEIGSSARARPPIVKGSCLQDPTETENVSKAKAVIPISNRSLAVDMNGATHSPLKRMGTNHLSVFNARVAKQCNSTYPMNPACNLFSTLMTPPVRTEQLFRNTILHAKARTYQGKVLHPKPKSCISTSSSHTWGIHEPSSPPTLQNTYRTS